MIPFINTKRLPTANQDGVTLLESMIAMMIFVVGFISILQLVNVAINGNRRAQIGAESTNMAVTTIENLFSLNWDDPAVEASPSSPLERGDHEIDYDISTGPGPGIIGLANDKGQPVVRLITVTTSYVEAGGLKRRTGTPLTLIKPRM